MPKIAHGLHGLTAASLGENVLGTEVSRIDRSGQTGAYSGVEGMASENLVPEQANESRS